MSDKIDICSNCNGKGLIIISNNNVRTEDIIKSEIINNKCKKYIVIICRLCQGKGHIKFSIL
jgi:hypothetical protein